MSTREEIITGNLKRLIEASGLTLVEVARQALPELTPDAARQRLERTIKQGWIGRDLVGCLIELWGIDLAEFYLPIDPAVDVLHMKSMRLNAARRALELATGGPDDQLLQAKLRTFGRTLDGREAEVFSERLVAADPIALKDLGDRWGVSRERARQVEKHMVSRLRRFLVQPALA